MSIGVLKYVVDLEIQIANLGEEINGIDARKFNDLLISQHKDLMSIEYEYLKYYNSNDNTGGEEFLRYIEVAKYVREKINQLQDKLKKIFQSVESTPSTKSNQVTDPSSHVNDQYTAVRPTVIAAFLSSLYQKRDFLIKEINLIESKSDVGAAEAEILFNHLSQLYESYVKNQAKIENYVNGPALDEELKLSGEILHKVMYFQTKLKEIYTPNESPSLPQLFSGIHLKVTSLRTMLKESFTQIVSPFLPRSSERFGKIHQKMQSFQPKLRQIISPIESLSSVVQSPKVFYFLFSILFLFFACVMCSKYKTYQQAIYLNSLLDNKSSLIREIESIDLRSQYLDSDMTETCISEWKLLFELKLRFVSNQMKIIEVVSGHYLEKQKDILRDTEADIEKIEEKIIVKCIS